MTLPFLIFYLVEYTLIAFFQVLDGYHYTDLIIYVLMSLASANVIYSYRVDEKKSKKNEQLRTDLFADLDRFIKEEAKKKNVELDCKSYGHSKHLFCAIHPGRKDCKECNDYKNY